MEIEAYPMTNRAGLDRHCGADEDAAIEVRIVILDDPLLTEADRLSLDELSNAVHPPGSPPNPVTAGLEWAQETIRALAWCGGRLKRSELRICSL